MTTYIIKRILLMIPTFLFISLIIFLVLNLAPGRPGGNQVSAEGTQNSESTEARESYRIFKEQFNFDKPVLVNTRFGLTPAEVEAELKAIADFRRPSCPEDANAPKPEGCIAANQKPVSARIIEAQELLEDWGEYSVMPLFQIAKATERADIKRLAITQISTNAQQRLINEYGKKQSDEQRDFNRKAREENEMIRHWTISSKSTPEQIQEVMTNWEQWLNKNRERFEYTTGEKIDRFLFDTRFAKYWGNLARLDFGVSHRDKKPVMETIWSKLYYTIPLSFLSILLAYLVSVPMGVWSAYKQNSRADQAVTVLLFMLYSLPNFFIAVVLLKLFTVNEPFQWFPTGGYEGKLLALSNWSIYAKDLDQMTALERLASISFHLVLPVFCSTYRSFASLSRYARTGVLDVIRADYIRTARAKGLGEPMVVIKHAVRNGMIPILTLLGSLLPALIGGSVIIEYVFNIPGMGMYLLESIGARDYNAIMAILLISTVLTLVGLLVSDLSYAIVDPRISFD